MPPFASPATLSKTSTPSRLFCTKPTPKPNLKPCSTTCLKKSSPPSNGSPDLGSDFFRRRPSSREAADLAATLRARLGRGATVRELVRGDYLLLYSRRDLELHLLAIKHHRQLSFDFSEFWEF